jgi:hypothetical protein
MILIFVYSELYNGGGSETLGFGFRTLEFDLRKRKFGQNVAAAINEKVGIGDGYETGLSVNNGFLLKAEFLPCGAGTAHDTDRCKEFKGAVYE